MFDKLEDLVKRLDEVMQELSEPDVVSDQNRFRNLMIEQNELAPIVEKYKEYKEAKDSVRMAIQEALLASDKGMLERDIFEKYLDKHINGAYEITNFLAYDDSERGQYTVVVYKDQEKKKKIDTFGIDTSGNFTN